MISILALHGTDPASRNSARELRECIEATWEVEPVTLDLSAVESMSSAYADELFGVLAVNYDLATIFYRMRCHGCKPHIANVIREAINYRRR